MSTAFDPAHYIVLHHADKAVVFAIRGTLHLHDIASDCKNIVLLLSMQSSSFLSVFKQSLHVFSDCENVAV